MPNTDVTDLDLLLLERRVDALLDPWRDADGPGVTIGIVRGGDLIVHRHAGLASIEHQVPISADTRFRIASVSKQFTCAAILMLVEAGKLSLDDPARTYIPELDASADRVTVAHLMHNTAGIRDMLEIMRFGGADLGIPIQPQDLLDGIGRQRALNFAPGSRFLYSNSNFFLLGLIVERLSQQTLEVFLGQRIFAPLGMRDTRLTPTTAEAIPRLAIGYLPGIDSGWTRAPHAFPLGGEGGLVSSVPDLALWARNVSTKRVGATWLDGLMTQAPFTNGSENRYTRGLVARSYRGFQTWSHGGLWPGYRTEFLLVPSEHLAVIVIANTGAADPGLLVRQALDALLEPMPGAHAAIALPESSGSQTLTGRYADPASGATLDITLSETGQLILITNGVPVTADATADGRFASLHGSSVFAVRQMSADTIEVEQDAATIGLWHRVPTSASLPDGLLGQYRSDEMATEWTVLQQDGKTWIRASGPVSTGPLWELEPIDADLFRVHTPGALFRGWLDVRAVRDGGRVVAVLASGARAKRVQFAFVPI